MKSKVALVKTLTVALCILPVVLFIFGYGCAGTRIGNPIITRLMLEVAPVSQSTISSFKFCSQLVRLIPTDKTQSPVEYFLSAQEISTAEQSRIIAIFDAKAQAYDAVEFDVAQSNCSFGNGVEVVNNNGTYTSSASPILKFKGSFSATSSNEVVRLFLQPIVTELALANSNQQVQDSIANVPGHILNANINSPFTNYAESILDDSPLAFWRLNEPLGTAAGLSATLDSSSRDYCNGKPCHLALFDDNSMPILGAAGVNASRTGTAYHLNGDNQQISQDRIGGSSGQTQPQPQFFFSNGANQDQPFSIEAWINIDSDYGSIGAVVASYHNNNSRSYMFGVNASRQLYFRLFNMDSNNQRIGRLVSSSLPTQAWSHVVVTYDGSKNSSGILIYINGVRVDNADDNAGAYTGNRADVILTIGNSWSEGFPFKGKIDEVAIYEGVLPPLRIQEHYNLVN